MLRGRGRGGAARYTLGILAGAVSGVVAAPLGAVVALAIFVTTDLTTLGFLQLFSLGSVFGSLPVVALVGLVVGAVIGALLARVFG